MLASHSTRSQRVKLKTPAAHLGRRCLCPEDLTGAIRYSDSRVLLITAQYGAPCCPSRNVSVLYLLAAGSSENGAQ